MNQQTKTIFIALGFFLVIVLMLNFAIPEKNSEKISKNIGNKKGAGKSSDIIKNIQKCPQEWIQTSPLGKKSEPSDSLIIEDKPYSLNEVDLAWIKANCAVNKPTIKF